MKNLKVYKTYAIAILLGALTALLSAQTRGTPSQIRVNIDAAGLLGVTSAAQTNPISSVQFNNARLSVDASGNLGIYDSSGAGFAPANATYITQTANATLTNEQAIAALSSGILRGATTTGVITSLGDVLPVANGGTSFATYAIGDLLYASGSGALSKLADVAAGSYLRSGGVATAPVWSTVTLPNSATTGDLLSVSASNTYANIAAVSAGQFLIAAGTGTLPAWNSQITYSSSVLNVNGVSPITGTAGSIYIGNNAPDTTGINSAGVIHLQAANSAAPQTILTGYAGQPTIIFRRAGGTFASPSALTTNDVIASIESRSWGTAFLTTSDAAIQMKAAEAIDGTHHGSYMTFETTPTASTTRAIVGGFQAAGGFVIGPSISANGMRFQLDGSKNLQLVGNDASTGNRFEIQGIYLNALGSSVNTSGGASAEEAFIHNTTTILDATPKTVVTITIPNTAQAAEVQVTLHGTMGAGGAVGENEASATISYNISVTRTLNVNAVANISTGYGAASSNVAGAGTITLAGTLAAVSGGTTATNTIAFQATITRSGGSSTNHKVWATVRLINSNASGITIGT